MPKKNDERYTIKRILNRGCKKPTFRLQGYRPDGTRLRKSFPCRTDAIERRNELYLEDEEAPVRQTLKRTSLTPEELGDAETALRLLEDRSLTDVVSRFLEFERRAEMVSDGDIESAIKFFENHYQEEVQEISIYAAVEKFLENNHHLAESTQAFYVRCTKVLMKEDPNKLVNLFTRKDIQALLNEFKTMENQRTYKRAFSAFFNWAVNQGYSLGNPCENIALKGGAQRKIHILSFDESVRALKASTELFGGVMAPSVGILLFAGLRPSEVRDLKPEDIKEEHIVVSGGKMRRQGQRRKPICKALKAWLEAYPFTGRPKGWDKKLTALNKAYKPSVCVPDIFRHTSLSFQVDQTQDEAKVAFENATSVDMLRRHYVDMIPSPRDTQRFWALTPETVAKCKETFATPEAKSVKKVKWPSRAKLEAMVAKDPVVKVAETIGVSDNAVRKRCKKLDIELPRRRGGKVQAPASPTPT